MAIFLLVNNVQADSTCPVQERHHASEITFNYVYPGTATHGKRVKIAGLFPLHKKQNDCRNILEIKNYNGFQR